MGAGQSSSSGGGGPGEGVEVKASYYELLGVQRQAPEEEIKKAYRRKALELHPDRNYGHEEAATKIFSEVQAAYEVLSDLQERAWYDSHESAILRGDNGEEEEVHTYQNVRVTTADDLARVVGRFNKNVEFTDSPSGFFGFLREQFECLGKEEEIAGIHENVHVPDYPLFGHKDDKHDDVVRAFYAAWSNFSTVKTFAWKDKYRLSEAPDRRIRRLMERENEGMRQEARREFNEAVRSLVAFVRKRDPRYTPSTQSEAERQKTLRDAAAAQAARARAANEAKLKGQVPGWTKVREPEELEVSEEEVVEEEVFECVACSKVFKSDRQWEAHERSKKHQKAVYALQKKMKKDNAHIDLDSAPASGALTPQIEDYEEHEVIDDIAIVTEDDDIAIVTEDAKVRKNVAQAGISDAVSEYDIEADTPGTGEAEERQTHEDEQHTAALPGGTGRAPAVEEPSDSDQDDEYDSPEAVRQRLESASLDTPLTVDSAEDASQPVKPRMGKAAQKRAKKAVAATEAHQSEKDHQCAGCNAVFLSRTRLFQHIKDHGHAALKPANGGGGGSGSGKKKGRGKR